MINGIINVYKEPGYTSHDVVARLRGIFHQKKIGHTGTLDPDAEGVLPVCLGKATGIVEMLSAETKTYEAVILLGRDTDTQDISGKTLREAEVSCSAEELRDCLKTFEGEQMQTPPMYSALKHNGKRLYELAREGIEVEREPRHVSFHEIRLLSFAGPRATVRVTCSRGTYIRTLCHDIGEKLGCGGCMEHLVRTRVGRYRETEALRLDRIEEMVKSGRTDRIIEPVDSFFRDLPPVSTRYSGDRLAHNGNSIPWTQISNVLGDSLIDESRLMTGSFGAFGESGDGWFRVYDSGGRFIGVYRADSSKHIFVPRKMFYDPEDSGADETPRTEAPVPQTFRSTL